MLDIPILLAVGEKDQSVPVVSARYLRDAFSRLEKSNLTYIEYENSNHVLVDQNGYDHKKALFETMVDWYLEN